MSKGSHQRPRQISNEEWLANFERAFGGLGHLVSVPPPERVGQPPVAEGDEFNEPTPNQAK